MDETLKMQLVEGVFLFSLVWSVGATGDGEGRARFDAFFRELAAGGTPKGCVAGGPSPCWRCCSSCCARAPFSSLGAGAQH